MLTRIVSWLIVIGLMNYTMGCTVQRTLRIQPSEDEALDAKYKIVYVILNNGEKIVFDKAGGRYNPSTQTIDGSARLRQLSAQTGDPDAWSTKSVTIKTENIKLIKISEISVIGSIATVITVGFLIALVWEGTHNTWMEIGTASH